jgi:hypothetical protein
LKFPCELNFPTEEVTCGFESKAQTVHNLRSTRIVKRILVPSNCNVQTALFSGANNVSQQTDTSEASEVRGLFRKRVKTAASVTTHPPLRRQLQHEDVPTCEDSCTNEDTAVLVKSAALAKTAVLVDTDPLGLNRNSKETLQQRTGSASDFVRLEF